MQPLVSIVIPVYNGSDFLRDAIESALAQTYPRIEVVVVNDGSTDGGATEAIAKSFGDRIRYFVKPNGHVASALNHGIANMRGEYLSWLSHDDLYYPDKIATQVRALQSLGERTVVYGDYETLDVETGVRVEHRLPDTKPEDFRWSITMTSAIHGCTLLIPRACFEECGPFDTSLRTTQDYDMWFRISERFRFVHVPGIGVVSRLHAAQGTRALRDVVVQEGDRQLSAFISRLTDSDLSAANRATPARAYGALAARMYARGYLGARNAALTLASAKLRDEPPLKSIASRISIAAKVYVNSLRPLARPAARIVRASVQRMRSNARARSVQHRFTKFYRRNVFGGRESRSGQGSSLVQTETIRREIPGLIQALGVRTMLDAPCGDFNWMQHAALPLDAYVGVDVVEELIAEHTRRYSGATRRFACLDIVEENLPRADLVFCRDCLVHLTFDQAFRAIRNFKRSGAEYLLTTTFPGTQNNLDLGPGDIWRALNLERPPFDFPAPLRLLNEGCTENRGAFADKSLGLWRLRDIEIA
jgi:hypothetical protein